MAKNKNTDIWADWKSGQGPSSSSDNFPVSKKKKQKKLTVKDVKTPTKAVNLNEEKYKNPLTQIEKSPQSEANISTAVSAALSKAIHEEYDVDKLEQILDVVIDQVDDADLANEHFERNNFGLVALLLGIIGVIAMIIIVPIVILFGKAIEFIDGQEQLTEANGFVADDTEFLIYENGEGVYLTSPDEEGETKFSTYRNNASGTFIFHELEDSNELSLGWIPELGSNRYDDPLVLSYEDGDIEWVYSSTIDEPTSINPVKRNAKDNEFLFSIEGTDKYLGLVENEITDPVDGSIDTSMELGLVDKPDYFTLIATASENLVITSTEQLTEDLERLEGIDPKYGIGGNNFSLMHTGTGLYVESYIDVNKNELPFFKMGGSDYFDNALRLSDRQEYNFFINPVNPDGWVQSSITMGSFQTTKVDWSLLNIITSTTENEDGTTDHTYLPQSKFSQYPLLSFASSDPVLKQFTHSYDQETRTIDGDDGEEIKLESDVTRYPETYLYFVSNPVNFHQKVIYSPYANKYIGVEDNKLVAKDAEGINKDEITYEMVNELDYFEFEFSEVRNPDFFVTTVDGITDREAQIDIESLNYENTYFSEVLLVGVEADQVGNLYRDVKNYYYTDQLQDPEVRKELGEYFVDRQYYSKLTTKKTDGLTVKFDDLLNSTCYIGVTMIERDQSKDIGENYSVKPIYFRTADYPGEDGDQSIEIETPEGGDPTDPELVDKPATIDAVYETSWIENSSSNNVNDGVNTYDILYSEMEKDAATSIDVTIDLTQGEIDNKTSGVVDGLKIEAYENVAGAGEDPERGSSPVATSEYVTDEVLEGLEDGSYTLRLSNLSEMTEYIVVLSVQDLEGEWFEKGETVLDTERPVPTYQGEAPEVVTPDDGGGRTKLVIIPYDAISNIEEEDTFLFKFVPKNGADEDGVVSADWLTMDELLSSGGGSFDINEIQVSIEDIAIHEQYEITIENINPDVVYELKLFGQMGTGFDDWHENPESVNSKPINDEIPFWTTESGVYSAIELISMEV